VSEANNALAATSMNLNQNEQNGTANSRRGLKAWLAGMKAVDSIMMMFGVHRGEKICGGFVVRFFL
jgi:hypothetical protein